jgi:thioredoxin 1
MNVTDDTYKQDVLDFDGVVVVDFWATWCTPCKIQGPIIDELAEKYNDNAKVRFAKLDTDQNPNTSMSNQIFSIPTLMVYKNGEIADKMVGLRSPEEIEKKIQELL